MIRVLFVILLASTFGCSSKVKSSRTAEPIIVREEAVPAVEETGSPNQIPQPVATPTPRSPEASDSSASQVAPRISNEETEELIKTRDDLWQELIGE